jgi:hypothetical protein
MRSGFHVTDSYLGNTLQSGMDDYQTKELYWKKSSCFWLMMFAFSKQLKRQ